MFTINSLALFLSLSVFPTTILSLPQILGQTLTGTVGNSSIAGNPAGPDANGLYTIYGTGIRASFIPYGASISHLYIKSKHGQELDVVLGFDNATAYTLDKNHPHFGGVPGRYANRIKNSSFELDGMTYNVTPNEHPTAAYPNGVNQLHGGPNGWDWRNWTVVAHTSNSITFSLTDPDGMEGFPGEVVSYVTYTLGNMTWDFTMSAIATTKRTPIMLSSHVYWNLDGFSNPHTPLVLNHSLYMPYGGQRVDVDSILIPTGDILANQPGSVNDFWSAPKQIGANFTSKDLDGNCGAGCYGYDTCWLTNRDQNGPFDWANSPPVAVMSSKWSGISLSIYTDQEAFQMYSCNGQNGSIPLKTTQGIFPANSTAMARPRTIQKYGCVVLEVEDWIDAINQPEWGRQSKHIFGPGEGTYELKASYRFDVD